MEQIRSFADKYLAHVPSLKVTDIVEIIIISFLVYHIMVWIKNTKAWACLLYTSLHCVQRFGLVKNWKSWTAIPRKRNKGVGPVHSRAVTGNS